VSRSKFLAPKAYDLLVALVRRAGRLSSKSELLEAVWPDSFVEEGILTVHISALRKALGNGNGGWDYIETVARGGYRFAANGGKTAPGLVARPEVYELFGKGREHLLAASMWDAPKAAEAFRAAIALEATYAAAHAGLALACCAMAEFRVAPAAEAFAEARTAALTALGLDDCCADAQVALGAVLFLGEWNWVGAERALARAIDLNPQHTEGYLLYGRLLEAMGQLERGLSMKLKALERDPFSPLVHLQIALSYWNQRRYDDSIEWANKSLALDPRHLLAREHLAGAYWKKGDYDRQMEEGLRHAESFGAPREMLDEMRGVYTARGREGVVRYALERVRHPVTQAMLHGEMGEMDEAFRYLDEAIAARDLCLVHLAVSPQWDVLRGDARFAERVRRMGLPCTA